jgi:hypothetical protein
MSLIPTRSIAQPREIFKPVITHSAYSFIMFIITTPLLCRIQFYSARSAESARMRRSRMRHKNGKSLLAVMTANFQASDPYHRGGQLHETFFCRHSLTIVYLRRPDVLSGLFC